MEQTMVTNVYKIGYSAEPVIFHLSAYKSVSLHKCPENQIPFDLIAAHLLGKFL